MADGQIKGKHYRLTEVVDSGGLTNHLVIKLCFCFALKLRFKF